MKTWATASSTTDEVTALDVGKVITVYSDSGGTTNLLTGDEETSAA